MLKQLHSRLHQLEQDAAVARRIAAEDDPAASERHLERIRIFVKLRGVERAENESLAEALCRALDISGIELRAQIEAGVDPIEKFLKDNGVFEEVERRKAAGTRPAAGGCNAKVKA
jgi:hypothetical protein